MSAPFLTVHDAAGHIHLILGTNSIANNRSQRSLDVGAKSIIISPGDVHVHYALQEKIAGGAIQRLERGFEESDLTSLGRPEIDQVVDAVFITSGGTSAANTRISALCKRMRIPVNVTDAPNLCTFTLPSLYSDGPLQIGITTSGMGCKLAARIRRHVYAALPPHLGRGVERIGAMRRRIIEEDHRRHDVANGEPDAEADADATDDETSAQKSDFNQLVADSETLKSRRLRWLSQICEHWPLERLASITAADIDTILASYSAVSGVDGLPPSRVPRILLAGSGPGSPQLLTVATHRAIQTASVVLTDKLVPSEVLALIPRRTAVHIAEKFPGNADAAQNKLLALGLAALKQGHTVLRLKQGDPYMYGRGGEEVLFFRAAGYEPIVLPGLTSALAAPCVAGIPLTHRAVADDVRIVTGVGRRGVAPAPPGFVSSQSVVALMVLNRLAEFVATLIGVDANGHPPTKTSARIPEEGINGMDGATTTTIALPCAQPLWPPDTPCAIVERASSPDQRIVRSTLRHVVQAFHEVGSRPPGLLVLGNACALLAPPKSQPYVVEEGGGALWAFLKELEREVPVVPRPVNGDADMNGDGEKSNVKDIVREDAGRNVV